MTTTSLGEVNARCAFGRRPCSDALLRARPSGTTRSPAVLAEPTNLRAGGADAHRSPAHL